ncbi:NlpC/P60 family protein [Rossellomorea marisflavi]|uniref:C40 family peptidase n=1 Tax=Rossellomorea marisflavi TaxID=189381 RepID=UPI00345D91D4
MKERSVVNVAVATLWTTPQSPRKRDEEILSDPVDMEKWIAPQDYESLLELCDHNLIQSQLLFGTEVNVVRRDGSWSEVIVAEQPSSKCAAGYPGWIPSCQLSRDERKEPKDGYAIVNVPFTELEYENGRMKLSYLTALPVIDQTEEVVRVQTPKGLGTLQVNDIVFSSRTVPDVQGDGAAIVKEGEQFLDLPYLWGGMSAFGYDCSGFSYNMCRANGVIIPRDANDQAIHGEKVSLDAMKPGDLLFFAYEQGKGAVHHVGIYHGNGAMIHSPKTGRTIEILSLKGTYYEEELCEARRYWKD